MFSIGVSTADAAPVRHRAPQSDQRDAEIDALKAQVQALTQRLDAQDATQRTTAETAQAAQAQAQAAVTQSQAAQAQVAAATSAVPGQVKTEMASWKPKIGWWDSTSISGRMYFNASSIDQESNGANSTNNGTGFNIKRFYLSVDHKFDDVFSADLTTDVSNVVGRTSNYNYSGINAPTDAQLVGRGLYIKKAYLQAKLSPALIIRAGSADLPWVPYDESIYGYRHIENTVIDRTSFGTSADWGVHVLGDLANGLFSYQVSVIDGGGYRNVKVTKSVDVEGRASLNYKGIQAAVGGYVGKLGNNVEGVDDPHTARRLDALLAYKGKGFTLGGEYFWAKNYNNNGVNYITSAITDKANGWSAFGSYQLATKWSVFGRYDQVTPRDNATDIKDHYMNAGIQFSPVKIVDLALVYKHDKTKNGTISTSNGTIGGSNDGSYDEIGIFGQLRW